MEYMPLIMYMFCVLLCFVVLCFWLPEKKTTAEFLLSISQWSLISDKYAMV